MGMERQNNFSFSAVALSVFTAAAGACGTAEGAVRLVVLGTAVNSVLVTTVLCLAGSLQKSSAGPFLRVVIAFWLAAELLQAVLQTQKICWQEFHSMVLLGLLPLLLWAGWKLLPGRWNMPARVLWWLVFLGLLVCLSGLAQQAQWPRLLELSPAMPSVQIKTPIYAEYLALPLLCSQANANRQRALPWITFSVQAGAAIGMGTVFGALDYPAIELLRGWSVGAFSRMDALLLLIWLMCSVFRIGFLCAAIHTILPQPAGRRKKAVG